MGLIPRLLSWLLPHRFIVNCDRDVYLRRWYLIRTRKFAVFIHQFIRSDKDRELHDHPWDFIVIPIWRGYIEHSEKHWRPAALNANPTIPIKRRVRPILGTRLRSGFYRHRVELLECDYSGEVEWESDCPKCRGVGFKPAWSIFIRFTEFRTWGFWNLGRFTPWNTWWQDKCE